MSDNNTPPVTDNFIAITAVGALAAADPANQEHYSDIAQALEGLNNQAVAVNVPVEDAFGLAQLPVFRAVFTALNRLIHDDIVDARTEAQEAEEQLKLSEVKLESAQQEIKRLNSNVVTIQAKYLLHEQEVAKTHDNQLKNLCNSHATELKTLHDTHSSEVGSLRTDIAVLREELSTLRANSKAAYQKQREKHQKIVIDRRQRIAATKTPNTSLITNEEPSDGDPSDDEPDIMATTDDGSGHGSVSRVTVSPAFDGKGAAIERAAKYRAWRLRIQLAWSDDPQIFNSEHKKFSLITRSIEGAPFEAIETELTKFLNGEPAKWTSASELLAELTKKYDNVDVIVHSRRELEELKMTKGMKWQEFEDNFTRLIDRCSFDDGMKTHYLRQKISERVRAAIAYQNPQPADDKYDEWLTLARNLAKNLEDKDWRDKHTNPFHKAGSNAAGTSSTPASASETTVSQGGNAMDLDAMSTSDIQLSRMIDDDVFKFRMKNGMCTRCGKKGHFSAECRARINFKKEVKPRNKNKNKNKDGGNSNNGGGNGGNSGRQQQPAQGRHGYGQWRPYNGGGHQVYAMSAAPPMGMLMGTPAPSTPGPSGYYHPVPVYQSSFVGPIIGDENGSVQGQGNVEPPS